MVGLAINFDPTTAPASACGDLANSLNQDLARQGKGWKAAAVDQSAYLFQQSANATDVACNGQYQSGSVGTIQDQPPLPPSVTEAKSICSSLGWT